MEQLSQAQQLTAHYQHTMSRLLLNAERDVRLAQAAGHKHELAKAQARQGSLQAAYDIYAAAYLHAYGVRPWPGRERQS